MGYSPWAHKELDMIEQLSALQWVWIMLYSHSAALIIAVTVIASGLVPWPPALPPSGPAFALRPA